MSVHGKLNMKHIILRGQQHANLINHEEVGNTSYMVVDITGPLTFFK